MNHQQQQGAGGRPPSYTNNYAPAAAGRTQSPMAPGNPRTPPTQMMGGPPPINTASSGYPPGHPAAVQMGGGAPPPVGGPPGYGGPPQYGGPPPIQQGQPSAAAAQYAGRNSNAVEVEGAGRSKAQLIVGIDFVSIAIQCLTASLISLGYNLLWCRFRIRDKFGGKGRHHYGMARCRIIHEAKGIYCPF